MTHQPPMRRLSNAPRSWRADPWLAPYAAIIRQRDEYIADRRQAMTEGKNLLDWADYHDRYGLHQVQDKWRFREWLPNADAVWLVGDFSDWERLERFRLHPVGQGDWEARLEATALQHGDQYRLHVCWPGGEGLRIPACARRVVRNTTDLWRSDVVFNAQVWQPQQPYVWKHDAPPAQAPLVYEAHIGMAQEKNGIGTFAEFTETVLPRIAAGGYNTVQLMAIQQHPYYGSFGYHVANFFAVCDLFGTPEEFKALVDAAHGLGLRVLMDLVQSHAVRNEVEGLSHQDGTEWLYFHAGARGEHPAWDSRCFDYGKREVVQFLLSNCRFWLEEYRLDGFRFDGVTSMVYRDHGLNRTFSGYDDYFSPNVDWDALAYLSLATDVCHACRPDVVCIAEDVSGMPGLAAPTAEGGCGFDFRLAMGVTDNWFKLSDLPDEHWSMGGLWHELTNRRQDEQSLSYVECHDQALVGGKTFAFQLMGAAMYDGMRRDDASLAVDRGVALHKLARLATIATAGHGYLNFMGNEFGHPEWIDFPRAGNGWSFNYARRQWRLADDDSLHFHSLLVFDRAMLALVRSADDFFACQPQLLQIDESAKVFAFERAGLYFIFNFHPLNSHAGYQVLCAGGGYDLVLDSDAPDFGGFGRVAPGQHFQAREVVSGCVKRHFLDVYVPARTVLVLRQEMSAIG